MKMETKEAAKKAAKKKDSVVIDKKDATVTDTEIKVNVAEAKPEAAAPKAKSLIIKLEDLEPFKEHPYKVIENDSMTELIDSIRVHGILNPLLVRPLESKDGRYEIISGHRRFFAAQKLGMKKVPCTVHYVDRDAATVMMVDSNCQRTELLPSEKAFAYKMKMDAIKRMPGRKPAENVSPVETQKRSSEIIAKEAGESRAQIDRYIRLTYLVSELLQFVDEGKIGMRPAVEMSYLDEETQRCIVDRIDDSGKTIFPSHAQTRRIREIVAKDGSISYDDVAAIMDEQKPNQIEKVSIRREDLTKYFPPSYTPEQIIKAILGALEKQKQQELQRKERQRDMNAR
jgi:ParB family chromosome partitioning protein